MISSSSFSQNWITFNEETPISVEYLQISDINVVQIPELSQYKNLKGLKFYNIRGVLNELVELKGLGIEKLYITASEINVKFWEQVTSLKQLKKLIINDVKGGELFGKKIKKLKSLTYLIFELIGKELNEYSNYKHISKLKKLTILDLQGNFLRVFDGDLNQFRNHQKLKKIIIDGNCVKESYLQSIKENLNQIMIVNEVNC